MEKTKKHPIIDRYGKANAAIVLICICVLIINSIFVNDHILMQVSPNRPTAYILNFLAGCEGELGRIGSMSHTSVWREGQWWRLFTHIYLHTGMIHMVCNLLALLFAGKIVEKKIGSVPYILLFHFTAVFDAVTVSMIFPDSTSVGASAGIFGMIGVVCVLRAKKDDECKNLLTRGETIYLIVFALLSLVLGLESFVTHFAAFAFGILAGFILQKHFSCQLENIDSSSP